MATKTPHDDLSQWTGEVKPIRTASSSPAPAAPLEPRAKPEVPDHELIRCIGRGSYGEVWLARNIMGIHRAVKVVYRSSFDHERPFEREFDGIRSFEPISRTHESQLNVLHVGRGEGCFYYIMELADDQGHGQQIDPGSYAPRTLRSDLHHLGRLPSEQCLRIALALTTALDHLHQHGLVHRDIKPSNVIFVNGIPKLADIGLVAKADATLSFVGTEGYVPPEGPGSPRADIYSLGKLLYEISTGRDRQDYPELPTQLRELSDREGIIELNEVIVKACHTEPQRRYGTAREMHEELVLLQSGKSLTRLRTVERTLARLKRLSAVGIGVTVIIAAGLLWESHQERRMKALAAEARENLYAADINAAQHALETDNLRQAIELLKEQIPKPGEPDLRGFEWRYLWRQCESDELFGLDGPPAGAALAISPNGRILAAAGGDGESGKVRIFDFATRHVIATLTGHGEGVDGVSFSASGALLATASLDCVRIWETHNFQLTSTLPGASAKAVFSPSADYLVTFSTNKGLIIWDVQTWSRVKTLEPAQSERSPLSWALNGLSFSPTGSEVAVVADESIRVLSVPDLHEVAALVNRAPRNRFVTFSPDGRGLAACTTRDRDVRIWDIPTRREIRLLSGHSDTVGSAAFSPDGKKLATCGFDQMVKLWDVSTGTLLRSFKGHAQEVWDVTFSPDGSLLISIGKDGAVKFWDPRKMSRPDSSIDALPLGFTADGNLMAYVETNQSVLTVNPASLAITRTDRFAGDDPTHTLKYHPVLPVPSREDSGLAFFRVQSPENLDADSKMEIWDMERDQLVCSLEGVLGPGRYSSRAAFAQKSGTFAYATPNNAVRLRHVPSKELIAELPDTIDAVRISSDGRRLITRRARDVSPADLWEFKGNRLAHVMTLPIHNWSEDIELSPNGQLLAVVDGSGVIRLLELPSGRLKSVLTGHKRLGFLLCFSRDGRTLASLTDEGTVRLWHVATGRELLKLQIPMNDGHGMDLQFSADDRSLEACRADADGNITRIWFAPSLAEIAGTEGQDYRR